MADSLSKFSTNKVQMVVFPGDSVVKNPSAHAGDTISFPDPGRSHTPRSN